ncbi:MAG: hypothetical protein R3B68_09980 [Phycisphaerales bacterium]
MLSLRTVPITAPLLALAAPALAQVQATATLVPVADAFVSGAPARINQNFGDAGALAIAPGSPAGGPARSSASTPLACPSPGTPSSARARGRSPTWDST